MESSEILSNIIHYMKYAKYLDKEKRRESFNETIERNKQMFIDKFPEYTDRLNNLYDNYVKTKLILPSMRSLQFAGKAINKNNVRMFNCAYAPVIKPESFSETMFLLLSGTGKGYSVQNHHIKQLPDIQEPQETFNYVISDNIEGWSDSILVLVNAFFGLNPFPIFDYSKIRKKGMLLITSGGKAPGYKPLKKCHEMITKVFNQALKDSKQKLFSLDVHSIMCHIADAVLSGGIRRASMIVFFDFWDKDMLSCKSGNWFNKNPHFARANNSAVALYNEITEDMFFDFWEYVKNSGSGEPAIYWTNDKETLSNPCLPNFAYVLTEKGIRQFKDVNIGDFIWSEDGFVEVINKWSTGIKPVFKYKTSAGYFVGTDNHKIVSQSKKIEVDKSDYIDLLQGETNLEINIDPQIVMDGLVIGDGSYHKASQEKIYLIIGNNNQDYFTSIISHLIKGKHSVKEKAYKIHTNIQDNELCKLPERKIPDKYFYGNKDIVCSFLKGLYSANGSIVGNRITLKSTCLELIEQVQIMLSSVGIRSYYTTNKSKLIKWNNEDYVSKQSYDLNISTDREIFYYKIGFLQNYKIKKLKNIIENIKPQNGLKSYEIIDKEYLGDFEVFDITVDGSNHTFWNNGLNVSNCGEASLRSLTFCNLSEINGAKIQNQEMFNDVCREITFLNTLQASYTDFKYINPIWKKHTEEDSLLGIGITGIASGNLDNINLSEGSKITVSENKKISSEIGINQSARITLLKPSGTSSLILGCSSGLKPYESEYYIRRTRINKQEPIYNYLLDKLPELLEDEIGNEENGAVISFPQKSPENALYVDDLTALRSLEIAKKFNLEWIRPAHNRGINYHNSSATIYLKDHEFNEVGKWFWENRYNYHGLTVLPYQNHTYKQTPFESTDEKTYNELSKYIKAINLTEIIEETDNTDHSGEIACMGGVCEIV